MIAREPLMESATEDSTQFCPSNPPSGKIPMVSAPPWELEIHAKSPTSESIRGSLNLAILIDFSDQLFKGSIEHLVKTSKIRPPSNPLTL